MSNPASLPNIPQIFGAKIEYGLIAAGISIAIIAVVNGLGSELNKKFEDISRQLSGKAAISQPVNSR